MNGVDRKCRFCGGPFQAKYPASTQRFCSRQCVRECRTAEGIAGRPWTDEDLGFLADNEHMSARELGQLMGRGMQSVQKKREQVREGWTRLKERWTEDELDVVRATPNLTAQQVAERLPGRTYKAVTSARKMLAHSEGATFQAYPTKSPHHVGRRRLLAKTCPSCGLFLDAEWWSRQSNGSLRHHCMKCLSVATVRSQRERGRPSTSSRDGGASARKFARKLQDLSLAHAVNRGKEWTEADMPTLSDPDLTAIEKALKLGRTYFATHTACQSFGFTSRVGRGDPIHGTWVIHFPIKESAA